MRDEMIPVKKHQIWFLTGGGGIERELLEKGRGGFQSPIRGRKNAAAL